VLALGGQVDYFIDTVFKLPTLAECLQERAFGPESTGCGLSRDHLILSEAIRFAQGEGRMM